MSVRVFSASISIESDATDDDLVSTIIDYFNPDATHETLSGYEFEVKAIVAGLKA